MAVGTFGTPINIVAGNKRITIVKYTGSSSYVTGGDAIPAGVHGMAFVDLVLAISQPVSAQAPEFMWNGSSTAPKLQSMYPQGGSLSTPAGAGTATVPSGATAVTSTSAAPAVPVDAIYAREVQSGANLSTYFGWLLIVGA